MRQSDSRTVRRSDSQDNRRRPLPYSQRLVIWLRHFNPRREGIEIDWRFLSLSSRRRLLSTALVRGK